MIDLRNYARAHGYRVRNLHDGGGVPPVRRTRRGRAAYPGAEAELAIVGRLGCVSLDGFQLYAVLLCRTVRQLTARLPAFQAAGVRVRQLGDGEAAGVAPAARISDVLGAIGAYRRRGRRSAGAANPPFEGVSDAPLSAAGSGGVPGPGITAESPDKDGGDGARPRSAWADPAFTHPVRLAMNPTHATPEPAAPETRAKALSVRLFDRDEPEALDSIDAWHLETPAERADEVIRELKQALGTTVIRLEERYLERLRTAVECGRWAGDDYAGVFELHVNIGYDPVEPAAVWRVLVWGERGNRDSDEEANVVRAAVRTALATLKEGSPVTDAPEERA